MRQLKPWQHVKADVTGIHSTNRVFGQSDIDQGSRLESARPASHEGERVAWPVGSPVTIHLRGHASNCLDGSRGRRSSLLLVLKCCSHWRTEAAEAMPGVWTWLACKGGEEPRCLCLLSVLKCCSRCGARQQRPCQLCGPGWLAREEKSRGEVSLSSLCAQVVRSPWDEATRALPAAGA